MEKNEFSLVVAIVNHGFSEKVVKIAERWGTGGGTVFFGRGSSERSRISILGVSVEPLKEIIYIVTEKRNARIILQEINEGCRLEDPKSGLAFSMPLDEVVGLNAKSPTHKND